MDFMRVLQDECNYVNYETSQICNGLWIKSVTVYAKTIARTNRRSR